MSSRKSRKHGFTQGEMLIIIVVIAILALIVIPRLLAEARKAEEVELRATLQKLRSDIEQFKADCGDWPAKLEDIQVRPTVDEGGQGKKINVLNWKGPYYSVSIHGMLPADPFTSKSDWKYDPTTGEVHSSSTWTAINGERYSEW